VRSIQTAAAGLYPAFLDLVRVLRFPAALAAFVRPLGLCAQQPVPGRLSADTDLSETVVFTLQGSRMATFHNNFNRRATQLVLSTVLQVQFFGDAK